MTKIEHIYVIAAPNGFVKIGRAALPYERLSMLQCGSPLILELAYMCECQRAKDVEAVAHDVLSPYRRHGEWFELQSAIAVETVRKIIGAIGLQLSIAPARSRTEKRGRKAKYASALSEIAVRC